MIAQWIRDFRDDLDSGWDEIMAEALWEQREEQLRARVQGARRVDGNSPGDRHSAIDITSEEGNRTMGWSGGNAIFDEVATALRSEWAAPELKIAVLEPLIGALQDADWDTEDESLARFQDDPAIVTAFRLRGIPGEDRHGGE